MKPKKLTGIILLLLILIVGSALMIYQQMSLSDESFGIDSASSTNTGLTKQDALNASYSEFMVVGFNLDGDPDLVPQTYIKFENGAASNESDTDGFTAVIDKNTMVIADVNGDRSNDAVFVLTVNTGGSGNFMSVVAVSGDKKKPKVLGQYPIGDRVIVQTLSVDKKGVMKVRYLTQGEGDDFKGMCCPDQQAEDIFVIKDGKMQEVR